MIRQIINIFFCFILASFKYWVVELVVYFMYKALKKIECYKFSLHHLYTVTTIFFKNTLNSNHVYSNPLYFYNINNMVHFLISQNVKLSSLKPLYQHLCTCLKNNDYSKTICTCILLHSINTSSR